MSISSVATFSDVEFRLGNEETNDKFYDSREALFFCRARHYYARWVQFYHQRAVSNVAAAFGDITSKAVGAFGVFKPF